jgi:hypothetical protein
MVRQHTTKRMLLPCQYTIRKVDKGFGQFLQTEKVDPCTLDGTVTCTKSNPNSRESDEIEPWFNAERHHYSEEWLPRRPSVNSATSPIYLWHPSILVNRICWMLLRIWLGSWKWIAVRLMTKVIRVSLKYELTFLSWRLISSWRHSRRKH